MQVKIVKNVLSLNDSVAETNIKLFQEKGILAINIMASPGSGKTTFILNTLKRISDCLNCAVIEGDIASSVDTDKIQKEAKVPAYQINTGGGCHLDANMVRVAYQHFNLDKTDIIFIENVGNLVCPASFKLGEQMRLVISSVPEGDDKPLKYPLMFAEADVIIISKADLFPYINFNLENFKHAILGLNPKVRFFQVDATTGNGFDEWTAFLIEKSKEAKKY